MRIDNNSINLASGIAQTQTADAASKNGSASKNRKTDSVGISSMAAQLSAHPERLAQLTQAYQNGTYNVSSSLIAGSLMQDALI